MLTMKEDIRETSELDKQISLSLVLVSTVRKL